MGRYILERLVGGVITVWFIATATFFAMHAVPGDPRSQGLSARRIGGHRDVHGAAAERCAVRCCRAWNGSSLLLCWLFAFGTPHDRAGEIQRWLAVTRDDAPNEGQVLSRTQHFAARLDIGALCGAGQELRRKGDRHAIFALDLYTCSF